MTSFHMQSHYVSNGKHRIKKQLIYFVGPYTIRRGRQFGNELERSDDQNMQSY